MEKLHTNVTIEQLHGMMAAPRPPQREQRKSFQATDKLLTEKFQATDKLLTEKFQATDKKFQATDKKFQETRDMINQMRGHFDRQFGKLVEALIHQSTIRLFINRGIAITHSTPNPERIYKNRNMEFDLLLLNDTELVILEAKVSLTKQKVYQFKKKMEHFKLFFKEYKNYNVHAGLAYITSKPDALNLAEDNGFYLLSLKNEEYMELKNKPNFIPTFY